MAYDRSQDYDLSDQVGFFSPLDMNDIDPQRALRDRAGVEKELDNRALGIKPPATPGTVSNGSGDDFYENAYQHAIQHEQAAEDAAQKNVDAIANDPTAGRLRTLSDQRAKAAQPIDPQGESAATGQSYKPTTKRKILRGLAGAGLGFAEHGLMGAVAGALDPEVVGSAGYSAPTRQYGIDVARQKGDVSALDEQIANTEKEGKFRTDQAKALAQEERSQATTFRDTSKSITDRWKALVDERRAKAAEDKANTAPRAIDYDPKTGRFMQDGNLYVPKTIEEGASLEAAHRVPNGPYSALWKQQHPDRTGVAALAEERMNDAREENAAKRQDRQDAALERRQDAYDKKKADITQRSIAAFNDLEAKARDKQGKIIDPATLENRKKALQGQFEAEFNALGARPEADQAAPPTVTPRTTAPTPAAQPAAKPAAQQSTPIERKVKDAQGNVITAIVQNGKWVNKTTKKPL